MSKGARNRAGSARQQRLAEIRAAERRARLRRQILIATAAMVVVAGIVAGVVAGLSGGGSKAPAAAQRMGPEGIPLEDGPALAPASTAATGQTVDGIQCDASEQVVYHIHAHLAVYVNGQPRKIPLGVGIVEPVVQQTSNGPFASASRCYYWLHTHTTDGIIHIESPSQRTYTLGQFFDIWRQPLSPTQVGPATGRLTVFVDGRRYAGNPRSIPLRPHADIQIDVGKVVPPQPVNWSRSQL